MSTDEFNNVETQDDPIARMVEDADIAGIARLYMEACHTANWTRGLRNLNEAKIESTLPIWMNDFSIPLCLYAQIHRVILEFNQQGEFGKTRLGKSNTMRTVATPVYEHACETDEIGRPTGGYVNYNVQNHN